MGAIRLVRRFVFIGSAALSVAAGLGVQFTDAMVSDVRHASTAELLLVLVLTAAPVATLALLRLTPTRPSRAMPVRATPLAIGATTTMAARTLRSE